MELLLFGNPPDTSAILSKSSMAQVDDGLFLGSFLHADNTYVFVFVAADEERLAGRPVIADCVTLDPSSPWHAVLPPHFFQRFGLFFAWPTEIFICKIAPFPKFDHPRTQASWDRILPPGVLGQRPRYGLRCRKFWDMYLGSPILGVPRWTSS